MITLHEETVVPRSPRDCFRYLADFRNAVEWDATAIRADKVTAGPVGEGSQFDLDCAVGPTSLRLFYEIQELQPWHSIVLIGTGRHFDVRDTITFSETEQGTKIAYTAEFKYKGAIGGVLSQFEAGMRAMGAKTIAGIRDALTDDNPTPTLRPATARADRWLLPGVAMFTRWGYKRGLAHWPPMTRFMDDKHVVITGANSGLGLATAIALAESGARLTLVVRSEEKATQLRQDIRAETGVEDIHVELADLSLMADVDALADRLIQRGQAIDVLVNNAGALFADYAQTDEGIERSFALLLLSPWLLTNRLKPLLRNHETKSRVINVVSGGMYTEQLDCDNLIMNADNFEGARAYARAKRGLSVLTEQWAQTWASDNIVVNAMHPGWADTPGVASALPRFRAITRRVLRNLREGADTIIWLARASEADRLSGRLFLDREPRTPYLLRSTRESIEERARLDTLLTEQLAHALPVKAEKLKDCAA